MATDEFAEFEDLETKIVEENSTPKTAVSVPEILEEVEKPAPSPFEKIVTSQIEGVVEIITEQVNPIVEEIQESVTEEISSETNNLEPETVVEVITISEIETASETLESEEINPSPSVTPEPSEQK